MSVNSISSLGLKSVLSGDGEFLAEISTESHDSFPSAFVRPELSPPHEKSSATDQLTAVRGSGVVVHTPGDTILNSMEKLSSSFTHGVEAARSAARGVKPGEFHSSDWLNAQLTISTVALQCDVLAKVVGKATQSLETFLKNQ